jgi:hypothetical protein
MDWLNTHRTRPTPPRFVPQVEGLEAREVPVANFRVQGSILIISAPTTRQFASTNILVRDNGTDRINNVVAFAEAPFFPNVAITRVVIKGGLGSEDVTYNLFNVLRSNRTIGVSLDGGVDDFAMNIRRGIDADTELTVNVDLGSQDDTFSVQSRAAIGRDAALRIVADGSLGNDKMRVDMRGTLAADALFACTMFGGAGHDSLDTFSGGVVTGSVDLYANAGQGNDRVRTDVIVSQFSTGTVTPGQVVGGSGRDRLRFVVRDFGRAITFNQLANGGPGVDVLVRTSNVFQIGCEFDNVVA